MGDSISFASIISLLVFVGGCAITASCGVYLTFRGVCLLLRKRRLSKMRLEQLAVEHEESDQCTGCYEGPYRCTFCGDRIHDELQRIVLNQKIVNYTCEGCGVCTDADKGVKLKVGH